ncbi:rab GTPase activator [Plasmodium brasilianum]|uniref:Rab GTPase activator n=1 Tax=Plasmodium brasilianum TaxID=5824 RepID=A0ACB9Y778_PLABR|nr:rab GTPase activator [Plasmodium brasilianum]
MKKIYKGTKTDEIFKAHKNKYHHLISKNHIYNNIYLNLEVYEKWRNLNIDKDENAHWNEKSLSMILNVDSNLKDKEVKQLLRRGVSDSLKHLIWIRSNDVNYFIINFPHFYETTIYNTFGEKVPSNLSNDCPTFCGGILGFQEDIMCVQTKIEELEIEHNDDCSHFNINDSTSNILQLLFNSPNDNEKKKDKYLLPEHNFWIEPKTLSTPNFGFMNKKKKKKFLNIENVKNKLLRNKRIDNYLRVASDSVLPYSNNFILKNISSKLAKYKTDRPNNGSASKKINTNTNANITTYDKTTRKDNNIGIREASRQFNNQKEENIGDTNDSNIHKDNNFKHSNCSDNEKNILIKDDIIIFHNGSDDTSNGGSDVKHNTQRRDENDININSNSSNNIVNKNDYNSNSSIITVNRNYYTIHRNDCNTGCNNSGINNNNCYQDNQISNISLSNDLPDSNKYLHIQCYMTEQYIISKKQAEKMNKAKLYLRTTRKKQREREEGYKIKSKSYHDTNKSVSAQNSDNSMSTYYNEKMFNNEINDDYSLSKFSSYHRTKSFFKKAFSAKYSNKKNDRKLSDHISYVLKKSLCKDRKGKKNVISNRRNVKCSKFDKGIEFYSSEEEVNKYKKKKKKKMKNEWSCEEKNEGSCEEKNELKYGVKNELKYGVKNEIGREDNSSANAHRLKRSKSFKRNISSKIEVDEEQSRECNRSVYSSGSDHNDKREDSIIKLSHFNSKESERYGGSSFDYHEKEMYDLRSYEKRSSKKSIFGKLKNIFYKKKKSQDNEEVGTIKCANCKQGRNYIKKKNSSQEKKNSPDTTTTTTTVDQVNDINRDGGINDMKKNVNYSNDYKKAQNCNPYFKDEKREINRTNKFSNHLRDTREGKPYITSKSLGAETIFGEATNVNKMYDYSCISLNNTSVMIDKNHPSNKNTDNEYNNKYNIIISNHENKVKCRIDNALLHDDICRNKINYQTNIGEGSSDDLKGKNSKSFLSKFGKSSQVKSYDKTSIMKPEQKESNDSDIDDSPFHTCNKSNSFNERDEDAYFDVNEEVGRYLSADLRCKPDEDEGIEIIEKEDHSNAPDSYPFDDLSYKNDLEDFKLPSNEFKEYKDTSNMTSKENKELGENGLMLGNFKGKKGNLVYQYYKEDSWEEEEDKSRDSSRKGSVYKEKVVEEIHAEDKHRRGTKMRQEEDEEEIEVEKDAEKVYLIESKSDYTERGERERTEEASDTGNTEEAQGEGNRKIKKGGTKYTNQENANFEKELYNKFYEKNSQHCSAYPNVYNLDDATELTALLNDNGKHEIKKLLWAINNNFGNDIEFAPIIPNLCIILLIYFKASVVYCIIHCLIKKGIDSIKNKELPFFIYKRKDFVKYVKYILNTFIQFLPKCYHYLRKLNFDLAAWTARCIQDGFSRMLPFDFVLRIYGTFLFEGQKTLCLYCLALLKFLENDILKCSNIEEVENILYHICMHPYLNINELTQIAYRFKLKSKEKHMKFSTKCPSPYLMNVKIKTFYRPRLNDNSRLISSFHWENIWERIPSNNRSLDPILTFCTKKDGYNLQILLEKTEKNKKKPMILILHTFDYDLIGFFCPFSFNRDYNFVNTSDKSSAFLCTFNSAFKFYRWSGKNNTLVLIRDGIYIGGNDIALYIDKDIKVGKTHFSESFLSPPLISNGHDFHIMDIEIWNLK